MTRISVYSRELLTNSVTTELPCCSISLCSPSIASRIFISTQNRRSLYLAIDRSNLWTPLHEQQIHNNIFSFLLFRCHQNLASFIYFSVIRNNKLHSKPSSPSEQTAPVYYVQQCLGAQRPVAWICVLPATREAGAPNLWTGVPATASPLHSLSQFRRRGRGGRGISVLSAETATRPVLPEKSTLRSRGPRPRVRPSFAGAPGPHAPAPRYTTGTHHVRPGPSLTLTHATHH